MARFKRNVEKTPVRTVETTRSWISFLEDWGRVAVPVGLVAVLAALRLLGAIDDTGLGYVIGLLVLISLGVGLAVIVWRNEFPNWVRKATIGALVVYFAGSVVPFHLIVYPGTPVFQENVSKDREVPLNGVEPGPYVIEIYATELANLNEARGEGQYKLIVAGQEISGKFADALRNVRAGRKGTRQVEQKHLMEVHNITVPEGDQTLKLTRLDTVIGSQVRVALFTSVIPPVVMYVLLALALLFAVTMDGLFQEATERWRLGPWVGMAIAFLLIFNSAYERGSVTSASVWSAIFGGVCGFLGGWLLGWMARKLLASLRTHI